MGAIVSIAIAFMRLTVLSRILSPVDFGIFVVGNSLTVFLATLVQGLFAAALIQRGSSVLSSGNIASAFVWSSASGILLATLVATLQDDLLRLVRLEEGAKIFGLMIPALVVRCIGHVPLSLIQRDLRFKQELVCNVASLITGTVVSIVVAASGMGYLALVYGAWVEATVLAATALTYTHKQVLREPTALGGPALVRQFGGAYAATFALGSLAQQGQHLLLSATQSTLSVGYFARAHALFEAITGGFLGAIVNRLFRIFPLLRNEPNRFRTGFETAIEGLATISLPLSATLFSASMGVVLIVMGSQWKDAAPIFGLFALGVMPRLCYKVTEFAAYSLNRPATTVWRAFINLCLVGGAVTAFAQFGLFLVALSLLTVNFINYLLSASTALRLLGVSWRRFALLHARGLALAVVAMSIQAVVRQTDFSSSNQIIADMIGAGAAIIGVVSCCLMFPQYFLGERLRRVTPKIRFTTRRDRATRQPDRPGNRC